MYLFHKFNTGCVCVCVCVFKGRGVYLKLSVTKTTAEELN